MYLSEINFTCPKNVQYLLLFEGYVVCRSCSHKSGLSMVPLLISHTRNTKTTCIEIQRIYITEKTVKTDGTTDHY